MARPLRLAAPLLAAILAACSSTPAGSTAPSIASSVPSAAPPAASASAAASTAASAAATAESTPEGEPVVAVDVSDLVEQARARAGVVAMAGAVVTPDGILAIGASGVRRAGSTTPVTIDDVWHIGSNLKAITAALAAIAVDDGAIDWDTTIAEAYPELGDTIRAEYRDVTLLQLLSMQGGLEGSAPPGDYPATTAREQRDQVVTAALTLQAPYGPVGSYYYSNLSTVTAASMVERALGGTYEELLADRLAEPVGATHIGWGPTVASGDGQPVGHSLANGAWTPCDNCDNPPWLSAAGRAHMTIGDWAAITRELMLAENGDSSIISQESADTLTSGHVVMPGGTDRYGLGWTVTRRQWGGTTVTHEGSNNLNHSIVWVGLSRDVALLAVTNTADLAGGTTGAALDDLIGSLLTWYQSQ